MHATARDVRSLSVVACVTASGATFRAGDTPGFWVQVHLTERDLESALAAVRALRHPEIDDVPGSVLGPSAAGGS